MKLNEIRIGNWLWHSTYQKQVQVKKIMDDSVWFNEGVSKGEKFYSNISKLEGIDITKELLAEQCGFYEMVLNKNWILQIEIFNEDTVDEQGVRLNWSEEEKEMMIEMHSSCDDEFMDEEAHFMIVPVTQLHQLQNLFHSLTAKELELKLK